MALWFGSVLMDITVLMVFIIISLIIYTKYKFNYWARHGIAYLEPSFPFGNAKQIILKRVSLGNSFKNFYDEFKKRNLPYGGTYFTFKPELVLVDKDIIKQIFIKDFQYFTDRGTFCDEENDPLSAHLFSLGGAKWKNLRAKLTPTFTTGKMKMMFHTMVACTNELDNILQQKSNTSEPLDIRDLLASFTTDVIGSCAFGLDINCLKTPDTKFKEYGTRVFEPQGIDIVRTLAGVLIPNFMKFFKLAVINKEISDFFKDVVFDTVKYREENNIVRKDFMHLLLQLKNQGKVSEDHLTAGSIKANGTKNEGNGLTDNQIAAQCFVFFLAGFETSSTMMTFCLYELVKNLQIQEKLRMEINKVLNKHNGELTYEAIMEMEYLDKVVNETLRKYPPLPFLVRQCVRDYQLPNSNYTIKKGQMLRIPLLGIHRDAEYYPDPEKFDPERFSDEQKSKRHPIVYMPFGEGPRICIGLRFGLMQGKVGLAVLLKNYKFTLNSKTKEPLEMNPKSITMSTIGGIWLDVHKV